MPIELTTPITREIIEYKYILLSGLKITQEATTDSTIPPVYSVQIRYKLYAIDSNGNRKFKKQMYSIDVPDYLQTAEAQSVLGDDRMLLSITAIEAALAKLISEKSILGTTVVTP